MRHVLWVSDNGSNVCGSKRIFVYALVGFGWPCPIVFLLTFCNKFDFKIYNCSNHLIFSIEQFSWLYAFYRSTTFTVFRPICHVFTPLTKLLKGFARDGTYDLVSNGWLSFAGNWWSWRGMESTQRQETNWYKWKGAASLNTPDFPYFRVELFEERVCSFYRWWITVQEQFWCECCKGYASFACRRHASAPQRDSLDSQKQAVADFRRDWDSFDWTKQLD